MSDAKRYRPEIHAPADDRKPWARMMQHEHGDWVSFEELEETQAQLAQAQGKIDALKSGRMQLRAERDSAESSLAQAREQLSLAAKTLSGYEDVNTTLEAENEQLRERLAGAMEWVPIAEADLKPLEKVTCWFSLAKEVAHDMTYDADLDLFTDDFGGEYVMDEVSHVLRFKPPKAEPEL